VTLSFCVDLDLTKPLCAAPALRSTPRSAGVPGARRRLARILDRPTWPG
jgi:hypothetical protein